MAVPKPTAGVAGKWKNTFEYVLEQLNDPDYVQTGLANLKQYIARIDDTPFIQAQLKAVGRSGDSAGAETLRAGQFSLGKARRVSLDDHWSMGSIEDRSDRWILQQWMFVRDCVWEWKQRKSAEALEAVLPRVTQWTNINLSSASLERGEDLAWHDHTTALRALNLIWLVYLLKATGAPEDSYLATVFKLIQIHTSVLASDSFYSIGTNHGFDQAYALYLLTTVFPISNAQKDARPIARDRLVHEMNVGFNSEGVHIENSPGYHVAMLPRLLKAQALLDAFDEDEHSNVKDTVEKAMHFLTHCLKPDTTVPLLGDTETIPQTADLDALKEFSGFSQLQYAYTGGKAGEEPAELTAVYPEAGYAFMRDRWRSPDNPHCTHLSFKCGFLSTYHRHDDDNTILLHAFGEDWLIGSGIYKYHEEDPIRRYLRSPEAHNLLSVDGVAPDRTLQSVRSYIKSYSTTDGVTRLAAKSQMFPGFTYEREVTFEPSGPEIRLNDKMMASSRTPCAFWLRFHVPGHLSVKVLSLRRVIVSSPQSDTALLITLATLPDVVDVVCGQTMPPLGWTSPERGIIKPAQAVCFMMNGPGSIDITSRLSFIQTNAADPP